MLQPSHHPPDRSLARHERDAPGDRQRSIEPIQAARRFVLATRCHGGFPQRHGDAREQAAMIALSVAGMVLSVLFNVMIVAKLVELQDRIEYLEEEL